MERICQQMILSLIIFTFSMRAQSIEINRQQLKLSDGSPQKISFILPSFVIHGITPSPQSSAFMPRRLDGNGQSVLTPGLGFEYHDVRTGFLMIAAVIRDCYDNAAGTLQAGSMAQIGRDTYLGLTAGLYVRKTPISCRTVESETVFNDFQSASTATSIGIQTECVLLDGLSENFRANLGSGTIDVIPMPFVQFSSALFKSHGLQIDLKIMSNYLLSEIGLGIPF